MILIRIFIGFDFDETMKRDIKRTIGTVKKHMISGKITDFDNLHLTLKFIGDIDEARFDEVVKGVEDVISELRVFSMSLSDIGYFDKKNKYRVLWMGITGDLHVLTKSFDLLEDSLHKYNFEKDDRGYNPHITIGRKVKLDEELDNINKHLKIDRAHTCIVKKLYIYNSVSEDGKRVYKKIKEYDLM